MIVVIVARVVVTRVIVTRVVVTVARIREAFVDAMVVSWQVFDGDRDRHAEQEYRRQLAAVVIMKGNLGQQVCQRNPDEEAGR